MCHHKTHGGTTVHIFPLMLDAITKSNLASVSGHAKCLYKWTCAGDGNKRSYILVRRQNKMTKSLLQLQSVIEYFNES